MELADISFDDFFIDPTTDLNRLARLEKQHHNFARSARYWLEIPQPLQVGTGADAIRIPTGDPHFGLLKNLLSHWAQCHIAIAHLYAERRGSLLVARVK